jgi:hypothetical protein
VVEAAARDGVGGVPQPEDPVHVQEVGDEGAVLVPALAGVRGAKNGSELRQRAPAAPGPPGPPRLAGRGVAA